MKIIETKVGDERIEVAIPEEGEVLGVVEEALGGAHFRVRCFDGVERLCKLKSKPGRQFWVNPGNYVLVKPWEYQKTKGWILYKYNEKQLEALRQLGYLKEEFEDEF